MEVKITEKGVHIPNEDGVETPVKVGTIVDLGDIEKIPSTLHNKCIEVGETMVVADEEDTTTESATDRADVLKNAALLLDADSDFNKDGSPNLAALNASLAETDHEPFTKEEVTEMWSTESAD